ncbi:MAG: ATP-binding protein [Anaerolineales bacterium]
MATRSNIHTTAARCSFQSAPRKGIRSSSTSAITGPHPRRRSSAHIFDKFYRGRNITDSVTGSGLGLAIVKTIVDNHQGRIWVESAEGKGSSFFIVLPIQADPVQAGKKPS